MPYRMFTIEIIHNKNIFMSYKFFKETYEYKTLLKKAVLHDTLRLTLEDNTYEKYVLRLALRLALRLSVINNITLTRTFCSVINIWLSADMSSSTEGALRYRALMTTRKQTLSNNVILMLDLFLRMN